MKTKRRRMRIELTCKQIREYANKYNLHSQYRDGETEIERLMEKAKQQGYMTRCGLVKVGDWKTGGRIRKRLKKNSEEDVRRISACAFRTEDIESLLKLEGVGWPMASVIFHFVFRNKYPILDIRAMNTVGGSHHYYSIRKWREYTKLCQKKAKECEISMRTLDKALWAYDRYEINPPKKKHCKCR